MNISKQRLPDEVAEELAKEVEKELQPEIDKLIIQNKGKTLDEMEVSTLSMGRRFNELLLTKMIEIEKGGSLEEKKMSMLQS